MEPVLVRESWLSASLPPRWRWAASMPHTSDPLPRSFAPNTVANRSPIPARVRLRGYDPRARNGDWRIRVRCHSLRGRNVAVLNKHAEVVRGNE